MRRTHPLIDLSRLLRLHFDNWVEETYVNRPDEQSEYRKLATNVETVLIQSHTAILRAHQEHRALGNGTPLLAPSPVATTVLEASLEGTYALLKEL